MKEKILELIIEHQFDFQYAKGSPFRDIAEVITTHVLEFIEWLNNNCQSDVFLRDETYVNRWFILEDTDDWDGKPNTTYSTDEIYIYWLNNIMK